MQDFTPFIANILVIKKNKIEDNNIIIKDILGACTHMKDYDI